MPYTSLPSGNSVGNVRPKLREDLLGRNRAAGVRIQLVVSLHNLRPQPALHGGIPFFRRAQTGSNHFAGRGVGPGIHKPVNIAALLAGQAHRPFFGGMEDGRTRGPAVGLCGLPLIEQQRSMNGAQFCFPRVGIAGGG